MTGIASPDLGVKPPPSAESNPSLITMKRGLHINRVTIGVSPDVVGKALPSGAEIAQMSPQTREWFLQLISGQDAVAYVRSQMMGVQQELSSGQIDKYYAARQMDRLNRVYDFALKRSLKLDQQLEKVINDPKAPKEKKALALFFKEQLTDLHLAEISQQEAALKAEDKTDPQLEAVKKMNEKNKEDYAKARAELKPEGQQVVEQFQAYVKKFVEIGGGKIGGKDVTDEMLTKHPFQVLRNMLIEKAGQPDSKKPNSAQEFIGKLKEDQLIGDDEVKILNDALTLKGELKGEKIDQIEKTAVKFAGGISLFMILMAYMAAKRETAQGRGGG